MALNTTAKKARKQRTATEIRQLLREFYHSEGVSVREYCEKIGVSEVSFYNWRKKYGEVCEQASDFIPLQITDIPPQEASLQMEVKIIKFYGHLCIEQLKAILL